MKEVKRHLIDNGFLWGPENNPYPVAGLMTYAPNGKLVKNKLETGFKTVFIKDGFDEIETPVLSQQAAWEASGHFARFADEMFTTQTSAGQPVVARSEIATTIYPLFNQLLRYYRGKLPFRVFQSGIVMPNDYQTEWQWRTRQYTAHEGHIFLETNQMQVGQTMAYLHDLSFKLMAAAGLNPESLYFREKLGSEKPFYASQAFGLYTELESGSLELLGIQYRGQRDFQLHSAKSGTKLMTHNTFPEVFEISFSTDRPFLALIHQALTNIDGRTVLMLPERLAPYTAAITTLSKQADLMSVAEYLLQYLLSLGANVKLLAGQSIGPKYKIADALGIPYVITLDKDTLSAQQFTLRRRDDRTQVILELDEIYSVYNQLSPDSSSIELMRNLYTLGKSRGLIF